MLPFRWLERVFGYLGLGLLVFAVAAIKLNPDWDQVAHGFVPGSHSGGSLMVYLYFVVGLLGAAMTPYEVYFYSSGAVEDRWGIKDLRLNNVTAIIGYALGGFLSFSLMIVAAVLFLPRGIDPAVPRARPPSPPSTRSARSGCCSRWSGSCSPSAARPSRRPLPVPTTWLSSSAGDGARRNGPPTRRASRSPGSRSSRSRCSS